MNPNLINLEFTYNYNYLLGTVDIFLLICILYICILYLVMLGRYLKLIILYFI